MTYTEAITFITSARGTGADGLTRMRSLLTRLGSPEAGLRFVHVAGTNGKGSVCAMLESILRAAGLRTGLFTSPHLRRYNERIKLGGESVSDEMFAKAAEKVSLAAGNAAEYSQFELLTAMALVLFAEEKCRVAVLETGLGGRLDPTNVIPVPDCAVITSLSLDHTALLGGTVAAIAREKAGIIKPGGSVVLAEPEGEELISLFAAVCRENGASLRISDNDELERLYDGLDGQEFCYCDDTPLYLPLLGDHQLKNAAAALEAVEVLRERGFRIKPEAVERGLAETRWPARFELVYDAPCAVVDGAHNVAGAKALRENAEYYFSDRRRVLVAGVMADKDVDGMVSALGPGFSAFMCAAPQSPRALPAERLAEKLAPYGPASAFGSVGGAIDAARRAAGKDGAVICAGSLYLAGEAREYFGLE